MFSGHVSQKRRNKSILVLDFLPLADRALFSHTLISKSSKKNHADYVWRKKYCEDGSKKKASYIYIALKTVKNARPAAWLAIRYIYIFLIVDCFIKKESFFSIEGENGRKIDSPHFYGSFVFRMERKPKEREREREEGFFLF